MFKYYLEFALCLISDLHYRPVDYYVQYLYSNKIPTYTPGNVKQSRWNQGIVHLLEEGRLMEEQAWLFTRPRRWVRGGQAKLRRAPSRLYRRRLLQVGIAICWKALDEIYKIYTLLHRSEPEAFAFFYRSSV